MSLQSRHKTAAARERERERERARVTCLIYECSSRPRRYTAAKQRHQC